jgi:hypothetical protein
VPQQIVQPANPVLEKHAELTQRRPPATTHRARIGPFTFANVFKRGHRC